MMGALLPASLLSFRPSPIRPRHLLHAAIRRGPAMIVEEEDLGTDFYAARCDEEVQENDVDECEVPSADEFTVAILGDLHVDPRKLDDYAEGRSHIVPVLEDAASRGVGAALVSLGDLGESKPCWEGSPELYAGTTKMSGRMTSSSCIYTETLAAARVKY